jgi:L-ascorbate metabolism protein UlaG (beta-lactamase superfamily)
MKYNRLAIVGALIMSTSLFCSSLDKKCSIPDGQCTDTDIINGKPYPKRFTNTEVQYKSGLADVLSIAKMYLTTTRVNPIPATPIPVHSVSGEQLLDEKKNVIYRIGHSTVVIKLNNQLIMTDPVFSERASPVQWAGPKRFHQAPITLDTLPNLDVVVISHDHYDHLDKGSIDKLSHKVGLFLVPLKVAKRLADWGVPQKKIIELDWWHSHTVAGIEYTLTPTQHFSGRGLTDRDSTLWGSWVIHAPKNKIFFSGDSGYFSGFKQIGERFGPFDLVMMETGAYNPKWSAIHMFPEQSVQAHIDLKGKILMPIHNSTFDLALHDWNEPLQRISKISAERGVTLVTPEMGQRMAIGQPMVVNDWWNR